MKRSFIISLVIALVALGLMSCDGTAISSPSIQAASKMVRTSAAGVRDTINLNDSLNVGDTVRLSLIVQGYYHYLTVLLGHFGYHYVSRFGLESSGLCCVGARFGSRAWKSHLYAQHGLCLPYQLALHAALFRYASYRYDCGFQCRRTVFSATLSLRCSSPIRKTYCFLASCHSASISSIDMSFNSRPISRARVSI